MLRDALEVVARDLLGRDLARRDRSGDAPRRPCVKRFHLPRHDTGGDAREQRQPRACPSRLKVGRRLTSTGIDKRPTEDPVEIGRLGLVGDTSGRRSTTAGRIKPSTSTARTTTPGGRPNSGARSRRDVRREPHRQRARQQLSGRRRPPPHRRRGRARGDLRPDAVRDADRAHGRQGVLAALPRVGAPRSLLPRDRGRHGPARRRGGVRADCEPADAGSSSSRRCSGRAIPRASRSSAPWPRPICERGRRDHEAQLAALRSP